MLKSVKALPQISSLPSSWMLLGDETISGVFFLVLELDRDFDGREGAFDDDDDEALGNIPLFGLVDCVLDAESSTPKPEANESQSLLRAAGFLLDDIDDSDEDTVDEEEDDDLVKDMPLFFLVLEGDRSFFFFLPMESTVTAASLSLSPAPMSLKKSSFQEAAATGLGLLPLLLSSLLLLSSNRGGLYVFWELLLLLLPLFALF